MITKNLKYLKILEYDKVLDNISKYCKTYIGHEKLSNLLPQFSQTVIGTSLQQTTEAISIIYRKSNIPLAELPDLSVIIKNLESYNSLSIPALLNTARFLKISREVKKFFFSSDDIDLSEYIQLYDLFDLIYTNENIEKKIFSVLLDENTVADDASPTLSSIRHKLKNLEQNVRDKLNSFIHSSTYSKYIMEPIVTIRDNRYVIPVKEEYKTQIKGFIHDVSSSGSTVFIEPINVFELNNDIANLKVEEEIEIEKILMQLSSMLYEYTEQIKNNIDILGNLDLIFAKAAYSIDIDGILPNINNEKYVNLVSARHPLIPKDSVVPIDISIGKDYSSLVITGPNTGGKTVALKTFGLLLLMAYSGIYIPAKANSSICIFDNIFVDIGDEQSIQENLSTFSSHISNIVEITNNVTSNSLILLDELGAGTDPIEGANLAISILKYFFNLGAIVISTTHYQELKNYCLSTEGFQNASFNFDIENLKPTYQLLIGIPGKSNAFAISKKLGLKDSILSFADSLMKQEDISIEELMKSIHDSKIAIEKEKEKIEQNSRQVEVLRKSLENQLYIQKDKQDKIIENAKTEARQILQDAKEEANSVIKELSSMNKPDLNKANSLRNKLNESLKDVSTTSSNSGINLEDLKALNNKFSLKNSSINSGKNNSKSSVSFVKQNSYKAQNVSSEINVIGMNVDEAIFVIDKYLDDCSIAKLSPVRIVHGKGTGKLREGIHKYLKNNHHVKSFRLGTFGEGEMGVTIVELAL